LKIRISPSDFHVHGTASSHRRTASAAARADVSGGGVAVDCLLRLRGRLVPIEIERGIVATDLRGLLDTLKLAP